ncbi:hypothetical protein XI06_13220 [Bradyrhizobium sp. CCBAU 11434]|nr:hypothetical protein [Bradyrhizobium sp. CCBAU 11434]
MAAVFNGCQVDITYAMFVGGLDPFRYGKGNRGLPYASCSDDCNQSLPRQLGHKIPDGLFAAERLGQLTGWISPPWLTSAVIGSGFGKRPLRGAKDPIPDQSVAAPRNGFQYFT